MGIKTTIAFNKCKCIKQNILRIQIINVNEMFMEELNILQIQIIRKNEMHMHKT